MPYLIRIHFPPSEIVAQMRINRLQSSRSFVLSNSRSAIVFVASTHACHTKCACADKLRQKFNMVDANEISHARISSCFMHFEGVTEQLCQVSRQRLKKFIECRHKWAKLDCVQADIAKSSYNKFDDDFVNGLFQLLSAPPC